MMLLEGSKNQREMVILTDGQAHGWSDEKTLIRWELLNRSTAWNDRTPKIWAVNLTPKEMPSIPNWSVSPMTATRPVVPVGREVTFKSELQLHFDRDAKTKVTLPKSIKIEVDGRPVGEQKPFSSADAKGRVPFSFTQRFASAGSHLVTVQVDEDALPGDNRAEYAIDVIPTLPILMVDGDPRHETRRGVDFLRNALAPVRDPNPSFLVQVVSISDFQVDLLQRPFRKEPATIPRVLILSNIAKLTEEQIKGIERFASEGGGVLIALGGRVDPKFCNSQLYRGGKGWLPARVDEPLGDENNLGKAAQIVPQSLEHPALELFKDPQPGSLTTSYFPRFWKLTVPPESQSSVIASLNNRLPFFVEKIVNHRFEFHLIK